MSTKPTDKTIVNDELDNERDTTRLEAFSDGVIAVAITLLIAKKLLDKCSYSPYTEQQKLNNGIDEERKL